MLGTETLITVPVLLLVLRSPMLPSSCSQGNGNRPWLCTLRQEGPSSVCGGHSHRGTQCLAWGGPQKVLSRMLSGTSVLEWACYHFTGGSFLWTLGTMETPVGPGNPVGG